MLRELLADGRTHVFDGAMGTVIYDRGVFIHTCYDELCLTNPRLILQIHRDYVEAGADDEDMHRAADLLSGGERLGGRVLECLVVVFGDEEDGHLRLLPLP